MKPVHALCALLMALALPAWAGNPRVLLETNHGPILLELYPEQAPKTVENFLRYVDSGYYAGTLFHRVRPGFMIQAGGYTETLELKDMGEPIPNESRNRLHNERGTLAMARTDDPDSATAQFFINVRLNMSLDYRMGKPGYTVFGRVLEGMDVVDDIALVETREYEEFEALPVQPVIIQNARRVEAGSP